MGKKWWLVFLLAALAVIGLVAGGFFRAKEPYYQGKSLSAWIHRLPAHGLNTRGVSWSRVTLSQLTPAEAEAIQAVQQIGTNALPYLMAEMRTDKVGFKDEIKLRWTQSKEFFQRILSRKRQGNMMTPSYRNEKSSAELRHWDAARGFHALGTLARPAIPDLAKLLHSPDTIPDAVYALSAMGPEGLTAMAPILINNSPTNEWPRICVIWALGQTPTNGQQALPELLALLENKSGVLRMSAVWALGQIKSNPELIAPALANHLADTDLNAKNMAKDALVDLGISQTSATALTNYLQDSRLYVRMAATNALKTLYPEEAVKAGIN